MKIVTTTHITLSFSELETLMKEKEFVSVDLGLTNVTKVSGINAVRFEFEKSTGDDNKTVSTAPNMDQETFLNLPIEDLDFSVRTFNCLKAGRIQKAKEILEISIPELRKVRNFGEKSIKEVIEVFKAHGLTLKEE